MRKLLLTTVAACCVLASPAQASTIPAGDGLFVFGNAYFDFTEQTVEFFPNITLPTIASGAFAGLGTAASLSYPAFGFNTDIPVTSISGNILAATANGLTASLSAPTNGTILANTPDLFMSVGFDGVMLLTGYEPTSGKWGFSFTPIMSPLAPSGWWEAMSFVSYGNPAPVPLPAAVWMFGASLLGLGALARKRRK